MSAGDPRSDQADVLDAYRQVRTLTDELASTLTAEDQTVPSTFLAMLPFRSNCTAGST